jgi:hypothetical protein
MQIEKRAYPCFWALDFGLLRPTEEGTGELVRNTSPDSMGVAALSKVVILAVGTRLTALTDDLRPGFSPWGDLDCPRRLSQLKKNRRSEAPSYCKVRGMWSYRESGDSPDSGIFKVQHSGGRLRFDDPAC